MLLLVVGHDGVVHLSPRFTEACRPSRHRGLRFHRPIFQPVDMGCVAALTGRIAATEGAEPLLNVLPERNPSGKKPFSWVGSVSVTPPFRARKALWVQDPALAEGMWQRACAALSIM
ncbi:hypothetical protein GCM10010156_01960 [Planobispora rosea]|uniref:Uncharacterized protein n=1 Tax=Planobispora rosea TaxID=35762 RepID=A0A8J3WBW7_PLARO|nr:hypothetical protein GCM10010156_01960 [Planobispora rosea]GIH82291.1 hypothetical protein Pro02_06990 [Planobispora rosea]